jgi:hypothetical protein
MERLESETPDSAERTTIHEAGHAVAADRFGWSVDAVFLDSDDRGGCKPFRYNLSEAETSQETQDRVSEQCAVEIAGCLAEIMFFGPCMLLEYIQAAERATEALDLQPTECVTFLSEAERRAHQILEANRETITTVATALLRERNLSGAALRTALDVGRAGR